MLSDPVHLAHRSPNPHPSPFRSWSNHSLLLMYWLLLFPSSTHFQMPCPPQSLFHVFCTALCVCHVHSVDTSLSSSYLPFSHLHCLLLRPGSTPCSTLLSVLRERVRFSSPEVCNSYWTQLVMSESVERKCWLVWICFEPAL